MDKKNRGGEWIQKNWQCKVDETTIQGRIGYDSREEVEWGENIDVE